MSDKPSMSLIWPSIFAAAVAVYGYATFRPALETARPAATDTTGFPLPPSLKGVDARYTRLWEDPLSVIYAPSTPAAPNNCDDKPACEESRRSLRQYLCDAVRQEFSQEMHAALATQQCNLQEKCTADLLVLPVLLPGDHYGDDQERRMRIRYSVVSGLSLSDYRPKFHRRLSYVTLPIHIDGLDARKTCLCQMKVPVELYVGNLANGIFEDNKPRETTDPKVVGESGGCDCESGRDCGERKTIYVPKTPVLICWLDERQLGVRPLAAIAQVLDHLLLSEGGGGSAQDIRAQVRVLGPADSDMLLTMAYENDDPRCFTSRPSEHMATAARACECSRALPCKYLCRRPYLVDNVRIYSPTATIAHDYLRNTDPRNSEKALSIFTDGTVTASGVVVYRTIGTDLDLAGVLKRELQLRGAWPPDGARENDCHVVLIAERDTHYGRAIVENYRAILGADKPDGRGLTTVAYLRGLDGETQQQKKKSSESDESHRHQQDEAGRTVYDTIEPEGKSQYDYLDRLQQHLTDVDRRLRDNNQRGITAIGVVGSDVFDKLLILRAMRKNFPTAQFFTTDLDANFWRKTELPTARNVIVASHFGLTLHPDLQRDVPPFRNSYQTSFFLATLLATDDSRTVGLLNAGGSSQRRFHGSPRPLWEPDGKKAALRPLLFEIGRHGPYQLTVTGGDTAPSARNKSQWNDKLDAWKAGPQDNLSAQFHPPSPRELLSDRQLWGKFTNVAAAAILFAVVVAFVVPAQLTVRQTFVDGARDAESRLTVLWVSWLSKLLSRWGDPLDLTPPADPQTEATTGAGLTWSLWKYLGIGLLIVVAAVSAAMLMIGQHRDADGEPFCLFEGISLWPSTVLLAVSAITCGCLFRHAYKNLKQNSKTLKKDLEQPLTKAFNNFDFHGLPTFESLPASVVRSWILSGLFVLAAIVLFNTLKWPFLPYRGAVSRFVTIGCQIAAYVLVIWLTQFVLIQVLRCRKSIKQISDVDLTTDVGPGLRKLIELVARRTDEVGKILLYPFVVLLLMYFAQLSVFDDWRLNAPLIVMWVVLLASLFWSALQMRRDAQHLRRKIVRVLTDHQARCADSPTISKDVDFKDLAAAMNSEDRGAYCAWTDDYLLRALAIPLGGSGGLLLLQQWLL